MERSTGTLREWLGEGPFSLALSSSWLGLFCHAGVVCALVESGLAPAKVCGSSGGCPPRKVHALKYDVVGVARPPPTLRQRQVACVSTVTIIVV